jgi:hypothetical protein
MNPRRATNRSPSGEKARNANGLAASPATPPRTARPCPVSVETTKTESPSIYARRVPFGDSTTFDGCGITGAASNVNAGAATGRAGRVAQLTTRMSTAIRCAITAGSRMACEQSVSGRSQFFWDKLSPHPPSSDWKARGSAGQDRRTRVPLSSKDSLAWVCRRSHSGRRDHLWLSALAGATRIARRAGTSVAVTATMARTAVAEISVKGSHPRTP